jgi:hypothetical protein
VRWAPIGIAKENKERTRNKVSAENNSRRGFMS